MNAHKGDPHAAWAGAEKRLQNATDTIFELRNKLAALHAQLDALKRERDALRNFYLSVKELVDNEDLPTAYVYTKICLLGQQTENALVEPALAQPESETK